MYRVYIENISVFNRVILNVKDYAGIPGEIDYTKLQITNLLRGIFKGKVKLKNRKQKGPKLFIISGGAASGKDEIIQAVRKMGKLQASILPKYTSRRQANDDGDEMICHYVPKKAIINNFQIEYDREYNSVAERYNNPYNAEFLSKCFDSYNSLELDESFQDYCEVQWEMQRLNELRAIDKPLLCFWQEVSKTLKSNSEKETLNLLFQKNEEYSIRLETLEKTTHASKAWEATIGEKDYVVYENNKNSIRYGFTISGLKDSMLADKKHRVVVASLPEIFNICKKHLTKRDVVTLYSYSQIDKDDFLETADPTMADMKMENLDDLIRYSEHIDEFDYVLIYATTSMKNGASGVKEELIDQMFRLFRTY